MAEAKAEDKGKKPSAPISPFHGKPIEAIIGEYEARVMVDSAKGVDLVEQRKKEAGKRAQGLMNRVDEYLGKMHGYHMKEGTRVPNETSLTPKGKEKDTVLAAENAEKLIHDLVYNAIATYEKDENKAKAYAGDRGMRTAYLSRFGIKEDELKLALVDAGDVKKVLAENKVIERLASIGDKAQQELQDLEYQVMLRREEFTDPLRAHVSKKTGVKIRKDVGPNQLLEILREHYAGLSEQYQKKQEQKQAYESRIPEKKAA